jgi:hypothetical protein
MFNEPREHHDERSGLKKHSPQTPSFQPNVKNSDVFPEHRLGLRIGREPKQRNTGRTLASPTAVTHDTNSIGTFPCPRTIPSGEMGSR